MAVERRREVESEGWNWERLRSGEVYGGGGTTLVYRQHRNGDEVTAKEEPVTL